MSDSNAKCRVCCSYAIGVLGAVLIMFAVLRIVRHYLPEASPINAARAQERKKILDQLVADNQKVLTTYDWVDQTKGIVRIPVERSMELTLQLWKDPAAGRSNLLARVEKATAKVPEKPSEFE